MLSELSLNECWLVLIAAFGIGVSKSGLTGLGMVHVIILAMVFGARASTGVLLPMLIVGDICSVRLFGKEVQWEYIQRLMPPALVGVVVGWLLMGRLDEQSFRPLVGSIILGLTTIQILRLWRPAWFEHVPHASWFAWSLGLFAGFTTMLANAAGPIVALYLLAVALPKMKLVGTGAWFFLLLNLIKVPFSYNQGLITLDSLTLNAAFSPAIVLGILFGRALVQRIPQRLFDSLLLAFTAIFALRLILWH